MAECYEDIIHQGRIIGRKLVVDPVPETPPTTIDRDDFIERFTPDEWVLGQRAAQVDPILAQALTLLMAKSDGKVNLASPRMPPVFEKMVTLGVLTQERSRQILTP